MDIYNQHAEEDIMELIERSLEDNAQQKVFTLRILHDHEEALDVAVVFEDRSFLMAHITIQEIEGKLAARIRGNYL